jgi:D-alanyl-D-alanine carboxypeptidase/D-alanyl-D-alanine-endopeptidase (penicillin-binding protein 4)
MKRTSTLIGLVFLAATAPARGDLDADIRKVLADPFLARAEVGIHIAQLDPDTRRSRTLFRHDDQTPLIPASNMKVVLTAAALELLGPNFTFRTLLAQRGEDLVIVGDGDPSFGDAQVLKKAGWESTTVFQQWAAQLRRAGLAACRDVIVDDSVFDEAFVHPAWPADQLLRPYCAQIAGMTFNNGCLDFYIHPVGTGQIVSYVTDPPTSYVSVTNTCVGGTVNAIVLDRSPRTPNQIILRGTASAANQAPVSITVHDPALYAATVLAETLAAADIIVGGQVRRDRTLRGGLPAEVAQGSARVLAIHETPLGVVLTRMNKDSVNGYAESLLKRIGFAASGRSGSWENGAEAVGGFLKRLGAAADEFVVDDGSGLSRQNRISARIMLRLLESSFYGQSREQFLTMLAVGGEDGTLQDRFTGPLRGRVLAKTGFIARVSALSGYVKGRDDRWYAFSILMNDIAPGMNSRAKELQEAIVRAIDANSGPPRGR